jgi:hypothetical protein
MRFESLTDIHLFLTYIGRLDLVGNVSESFKPDDKMMELFIKRRTSVIPGLKNFRKSQIAKSQWRRNKYEMLKNMRKFHKSTAGKKFHRNLGNFLATRIFQSTKSTNGILKTGLQAESFLDTLKSLSSLRTNLYIFSENFQTVRDQVDYELYLEAILPSIFRIESGFCSGKPYSIEPEDLDKLLYCIPENVILGCCATRDMDTSKIDEDEFSELFTVFENQIQKNDETYLEVIRYLFK